jgi:hypothetical protein
LATVMAAGWWCDAVVSIVFWQQPARLPVMCDVYFILLDSRWWRWLLSHVCTKSQY